MSGNHPGKYHNATKSFEDPRVAFFDILIQDDTEAPAAEDRDPACAMEMSQTIFGRTEEHFIQ
jgi:hypothetical protein